MLILSIETSCDETSVAIVKDGKQILSNIVSSQVEEHSKFGGVVPEIASRLHIEKIIQILKLALDKANVTLKDCDAIAVTQGPGLVGSLLVGIEVAKSIAYSMNIPLIPINHIEAHLYSPLLEYDTITHPYLGLIVSGGHTSLVMVNSFNDYKLIGETLDDAAGEAYDKVAKFLNLGYPGGPIIDKLTNKMTQSKYSFTIPKIKNVAVRFIASDINENLDFSFSGLKTAVINLVKQKFTAAEEIPESEKKEICFAFQETTVNYLLKNTKIAIDRSNVKKVVFAGGVAANSRLRNKALELTIQQTNKPTNRLTEIYFPSLSLCTDNAAMVAGLAYHKILCRGRIYASPTKSSFERPDFLNLNAVPNLKIG